jgi:hypothetical protein
MLSPVQRRAKMIDRDLKLSDSYFAVIHILRIAADWIQESMDDLSLMVDDLEILYFSTEDEFSTLLPQDPNARNAAIGVFRKNWDTVTSSQRRIGNDLLARIKNMRQEVRDLRDGVCRVSLLPRSQTQSIRVLAVYHL